MAHLTLSGSLNNTKEYDNKKSALMTTPIMCFNSLILLVVSSYNQDKNEATRVTPVLIKSLLLVQEYIPTFCVLGSDFKHISVILKLCLHCPIDVENNKENGICFQLF